MGDKDKKELKRKGDITLEHLLAEKPLPDELLNIILQYYESNRELYQWFIQKIASPDDESHPRYAKILLEAIKARIVTLKSEPKELYDELIAISELQLPDAIASRVKSQMESLVKEKEGAEIKQVVKDYHPSYGLNNVHIQPSFFARVFRENISAQEAIHRAPSTDALIDVDNPSDEQLLIAAQNIVRPINSCEKGKAWWFAAICTPIGGFATVLGATASSLNPASLAALGIGACADVIAVIAWAMCIHQCFCGESIHSPVYDEFTRILADKKEEKAKVLQLLGDEPPDAKQQGASGPNSGAAKSEPTPATPLLDGIEEELSHRYGSAPGNSGAAKSDDEEAETEEEIGSEMRIN